ncbi:hypothetical protein Sango_0096800 [Sesamum angolense]|uniref:Uncharacterized protein n=1 Tax=Sesamum angolense TaxID=2727404 RepID=A0AAE2C5X9_9LAMI|nr:hypothetical protein Sango_0096800 [Sesamum angolense]
MREHSINNDGFILRPRGPVQVTMRQWAEALGSWDWVSFENIKKRFKELTEKIPNVNEGKLTARAKDECIEFLNPVVFDNMNAGLFLQYSPKEVKHVLNQMHPLKPPGPDDISKAYDRMEWIFLEQVLLRLGERSLTKEPSIHLLVLTFCRGIQEPNTGGGATKSDPGYTSKQEGTKVLRHFEVVSGLMINLEKLTGVFSKNTPELVNKDLIGILEVPMVDKNTKYLGFASVVERSKRAIFECIKERIWKRFPGWSVKRLSHAGRVVMIKSIIQAIPTFAMSCFKIPKALLSEIESMITSFFRHQDGD